jgi:hypothetical protein
VAVFLASGIALDNSTNNTIIFSDPNASYLLVSIYGTIHGSVTSNVDVLISGNQGSYYLTKSNQVPVSESIELVANRIVLPSGQTLQARASASGQITVYTSLYQIAGS